MENQTEQQQSIWILESITIEKIHWGANKDKYQGRIRFSNGQGDEFSFKLNPTLANAYLGLIKDTVVLSANELAEKLQQSLNQ